MATPVTMDDVVVEPKKSSAKESGPSLTSDPVTNIVSKISEGIDTEGAGNYLKRQAIEALPMAGGLAGSLAGIPGMMVGTLLGNVAKSPLQGKDLSFDDVAGGFGDALLSGVLSGAGAKLAGLPNIVRAIKADAPLAGGYMNALRARMAKTMLPPELSMVTREAALTRSKAPITYSDITGNPLAHKLGQLLGGDKFRKIGAAQQAEIVPEIRAAAPGISDTRADKVQELLSASKQATQQREKDLWDQLAGENNPASLAARNTLTFQRATAPPTTVAGPIINPLTGQATPTVKHAPMQTVTVQGPIVPQKAVVDIADKYLEKIAAQANSTIGNVPGVQPPDQRIVGMLQALAESRDKVNPNLIHPVSFNQIKDIRSAAGELARFGDPSNTGKQHAYKEFVNALTDDITNSMRTWKDGPKALSTWKAARGYTTFRHSAYTPDANSGKNVAKILEPDVSGTTELKNMAVDSAEFDNAIRAARRQNKPGVMDQLRAEWLDQKIFSNVENTNRTSLTSELKSGTDIQTAWNSKESQAWRARLFKDKPLAEKAVDDLVTRASIFDPKELSAGKQSIAINVMKGAAYIGSGLTGLALGGHPSIAGMGLGATIVGAYPLAKGFTKNVLMNDAIARVIPKLTSSAPLSEAQKRMYSRMIFGAMKGSQINLIDSSTGNEVGKATIGSDGKAEEVELYKKTN